MGTGSAPRLCPRFRPRPGVRRRGGDTCLRPESRGGLVAGKPRGQPVAGVHPDRSSAHGRRPSRVPQRRRPTGLPRRAQRPSRTDPQPSRSGHHCVPQRLAVGPASRRAHPGGGHHPRAGPPRARDRPPAHRQGRPRPARRLCHHHLLLRVGGPGGGRVPRPHRSGGRGHRPGGRAHPAALRALPARAAQHLLRPGTRAFRHRRLALPRGHPPHPQSPGLPLRGRTARLPGLPHRLHRGQRHQRPGWLGGRRRRRGPVGPDPPSPGPLGGLEHCRRRPLGRHLPGRGGPGARRAGGPQPGRRGRRARRHRRHPGRRLHHRGPGPHRPHLLRAPGGRRHRHRRHPSVLRRRRRGPAGPGLHRPEPRPRRRQPGVALGGAGDRHQPQLLQHRMDPRPGGGPGRRRLAVGRPRGRAHLRARGDRTAHPPGAAGRRRHLHRRPGAGGGLRECRGGHPARRHTGARRFRRTGPRPHPCPGRPAHAGLQAPLGRLDQHHRPVGARLPGLPDRGLGLPVGV